VVCLTAFGEKVTWNSEQLSGDELLIRQALASTGRLPKHVAVIMDGNGRWAQERGKLRVEGHKEGMESVREAVKLSSLLGIKYLTLYAFSLENWKRPVREVRFLMGLLESYLKKEVDELHANNVRIATIGKTNALPKSVQKALARAIDHTAQNDGLTLTLALSYGGRWDIVRAMQMIALDVRRGKVSPEDLTEETVGRYLSTGDMPDPDLMIRTSGEMRLSNYLLWESAYTEIYVTSQLWPAFRREEYYKALLDYTQRERRFGQTSDQLRSSDDATVKSTTTMERILDALR
jgi:undecaprenyl diphosphate synthase